MNTGKTLLVVNAFLLVMITITPPRAGLVLPISDRQVTESNPSNYRTPFSDKELVYDLTAGYADELRFLITENFSDHIVALQDGTVDMIGLALGVALEDLHGVPDIGLNTTNRLGVGFLTFNCGRHPVNRTELRQAFAFALDKYALQERVHDNISIPVDSLVIPAQGDWSLDNQPWAKENNYYGADPVKGNQILDAHGWNDTDGDGWREDPDGNPVEVELLANTQSGQMLQCLDMAKETFESIGIKAIIDLVFDTVFWSRLTQHNFMIAGHAWSPRLTGPGILQQTQTGAITVNWSNATYNALVDTTMTTINVTRAKQACWDAQKILWHELPVVTLYQNLLFSYYRTDRWTGHVNTNWGFMEFGTGGVHGYWTYLQVRLKPGYGQDSSEQYTNWQQGGCFNVSIPVFDESTNPLLIRFLESQPYRILELVYDPLCRRNPYSTDICPWLAKDWELEELNDTHPDFTADHPRARPGDRSKITFYLHEGLLFHDGYPLTAEDVAYSFELFYNSSLPTKPIESLKPVFTHVEAVNGTTVEFYYSNANIVNFYYTIDIPVLPKHIWVNVKDPLAWDNPCPIGSGPYRWKYREPGNLVILKRNDDFIYNPRNYPPPEPPTTTTTTTMTSGTGTGPSPVPGFMLVTVLATAATAVLARKKRTRR